MTLLDRKSGRMVNLAAALFLLFLAVPPAWADTPALNRPFSKSSPNGQVILDMRPVDPVGETGRGEGLARTGGGGGGGGGTGGCSIRSGGSPPRPRWWC